MKLFKPSKTNNELTDYSSETVHEREKTMPSKNEKLLVDALDKKQHPVPSVPPWRTCLVTSLSFTLVYTAFEALQNLQSSINANHNLGVTVLAIIYGTSLLTAPLCPVIIKKLGTKTFLLFIWSAHAFYTSANFYPSYSTFVPAGLVLGATLGGTDSISGLYMSAASESWLLLKGRDSDQLHAILSLFNGVFFTCFKSAQIAGNLVSSLVLSSGTFNQSVLEENVCGMKHGCISLHENSSVVIEEPSKDVQYTLLSVFLSFNMAGLFVTLVFLPSIHPPDQDSDRTTFYHVTSGLKMFLCPLFLFVVPNILAPAMFLVLLFTGYTKTFLSCRLGVDWIGFTMMTYGASSALSSLLLNFVARFSGRAPLILFALVLDTAMLAVMATWTPTPGTPAIYFFLLPAMAGITSGILRPQWNSVMSTVFKDRETPAFSAMQTTRCVAFTLSVILCAVACPILQLYITAAVYALSFLGYFSFEVILRRSKKA